MRKTKQQRGRRGIVKEKGDCQVQLNSGSGRASGNNRRDWGGSQESDSFDSRGKKKGAGNSVK